MAKAKKADKKEPIPTIDHTPLTEVITELAAAIEGGTDVTARQATYDKLKKYLDDNGISY